MAKKHNGGGNVPCQKKNESQQNFWSSNRSD